MSLQVFSQGREAFGTDATEEEADLLRGRRDLAGRQPAEDDVVFIHRDQVDVAVFARIGKQKFSIKTQFATLRP